MTIPVFDNVCSLGNFVPALSDIMILDLVVGNTSS